MIVSRTPFRVSLFGGGTDYPDWYRKHGGAVLGFAIDKYCYISLRSLPPFFEHNHRIVYSRMENVRTIAEIEHPAVRAVLQDYGVEEGLEIHHDADLPARSGLGSSSAFTVGLINALRAHGNRASAPSFLGAEAIRIEQDVIGESVGSQDQLWAAHGGFNRIGFRTDGSWDITPIIASPERVQALNAHLLLCFTGLSRIAATVAAQKIENLEAKRRQLEAMQAMVGTAEAVLTDPERPLDDIGAMLHQAWMMKRELAGGVTNQAVDDIYEAGRAAGATGGKLLGAGGGGFMLFFVPPDKREAVSRALDALVQVDFTIGAPGSRIIVYEPNATRL